MKINLKPIIALVSGPFLLSGLLTPTAQAGLTPGGSGISGSSILADVDGANSGPEALTVDWSVVESVSDVYTYSYDIFNPAGDVLLPGQPNAGDPEIVDQLIVDFNTSAAGAVVGGPSGGTIANILASDTGVRWILESPVVSAGSSSGWLSFQSDLAPSAGNATANDANPPSPWSSDPAGQAVPVPGNGSFTVPDSASTMSLLAGMMLLLPFRSAIKKAVLK